jgi:hypothetical protein
VSGLGWLTGLTGLVKAFAHRRWVLRALVRERTGPLIRLDG